MAKSFRVGPILTILVLVVIIYTVYVNSIDDQAQPLLKIGIPEAKSRRFGLIIDVRTPKEREQLGYYPNSIPISVQTLEQQVPLDIANKNTWILVYCNSGQRSKQAAEILYRMGYKNVRYITESYLSLMPGSK
jgi:phage shock protein E